MWNRLVFGCFCLFSLAVMSTLTVGCGSSTVDGTCSYKGTTYQIGESFKSDDGCNTCTCLNGQVACTNMACAPTPCGTRGAASCKDKEFCDQADHCGKTDKAGECKPKPEGCAAVEEPVCGCDGKTYSNGCVANAAGVSVKSKGACAGPGKSCDYNGKTHKDGATFPHTNGCNTCTCKDGKVECDGEACPFQSCKHNGKEHKSGDTFDKGDGCNTCECFDGNVTCTEKVCNADCSYEGKTHKDGAEFLAKDGCNTCKCDAGKVTCTTKTCSGASCTHDGKTHKDGSTFDKGDGCNTCTCNNGSVSCTEKACPPSQCSANTDCKTDEFCELKAGSCGGKGECKKKPDPTNCKDTKPVCGCDGNDYSSACDAALKGVSVKAIGPCPSKGCTVNGKTYKEGDSFPAGDGCNNCTCKGGLPVCTQIACPPGACQSNADCKAAEYCQFNSTCSGQGKCATKPTACPKNIDPVCSCDGKTYNNACEAGAAGANVRAKGQCKAKTCVYDGKTYNDGDSFVAKDGCNVCTCSNGVAGCTRKGCGQTCSTNGDCNSTEYCARVSGYCKASVGNCATKPTTCTKILDPVCGCDGQTYNNACEAAAKGVSVSAKGKCASPTTCTYDGKTYKDGDSFPATDGCNTCTCKAGNVGCTKIACPPGACQTNSDCKSTEYCALKSGCSGTGTCAARPGACTQQYDPVCGCNGKTYGNACTAASAGENVKAKGQCTSTTTCTYDGKTYKDGDSFPATDGCNTCTCKAGAVACTKIACPPSGCTSDKDCKTMEYCMFKEGVCSGKGTCKAKPTACTQQYAPVCGCDDKTYGNSCTASAAGMSVKAQGACKPACSGCTQDSDCNSGEFCQFSVGQCSGCGACKAKPSVCNRLYKPVCGCDGKTYGNACGAESQGVSLKTELACP